MIDLLTFSDEQCLVLGRMSDEFGYSFRVIAEDTGVPETECRRIIRNFRLSGLAEYGPLFGEDDGLVRGSGYWLNGQGWTAQNQLWGLLVTDLRDRMDSAWDRENGW